MLRFSDMEVTALCVRLVLIVLVLLCAHHHEVDSDLTLHVEPNRLQFFEYECLTFHCDGFSGPVEFKYVNNQKEEATLCHNTSIVTIGSCKIKDLYTDETGQYWCEDGEGRSNNISITVTGGAVILESPVHPVIEGEAVTLRCRNSTRSSSLTSDFYKDGVHISSSSTGHMTIHSVSKAHEGLYRCSISGGGESAESRLVVEEDHQAAQPETTSDRSTPWIIVTVLLLVLLLVVVVHRHIDKCFWHRVLHLRSRVKTGSRSSQHQHRTVGSSSSGSSPMSDVGQRLIIDPGNVQPGVAIVDGHSALYATVNKNRRWTDEDDMSRQTYYVFGSNVEPTPTTGTYALLQEGGLYSQVQTVDL